MGFFLGETFQQRFLFNNDFGIGQKGVDETGVLEFNGHFKANEFFRLGTAQHVTKKGELKGMAFAFFVAVSRPLSDKFFTLFMISCLKPVDESFLLGGGNFESQQIPRRYTSSCER